MERNIEVASDSELQALSNLINQRLDTVDSALRGIRSQVDATNGRVDKLELDQKYKEGLTAGSAALQTAVWKIVGGVAAVAAIAVALQQILASNA